MKKLLSLTLALALVLTLAVATAFAVPSKTTSDLTTTGDTNLPGVAIFVTEAQNNVEAANAVIGDLAEKVNGGLSVARYFGDGVQGDLAAALPAGKDLSSLVCNELVPLGISGYAAGMGEVIAPFQFATAYEVGSAVVPMLGFVGANNEVEWHVLKAEVVEGGIVNITFPEELALRMFGKISVLAVLN